MPQVGTGKNAKHYPYTPAGMSSARKAAKQSGMPMKMPKGMPPKKMPMKGGMGSMKKK